MDLSNVDIVAIERQIKFYELQQKLQSLQASANPTAAQPAHLPLPPSLLSLLAPPPPASVRIVNPPPGFSFPHPVHSNPPPPSTAPPLPPPSLLAAPTAQELSHEPLLEGRHNSLTPEEAYHYTTQGTRYTKDIEVVAKAKGGEVFFLRAKH